MKLIPLLLICMSAFALDNAKIRYSQTANLISSRAQTLPWYFAQGDIPNNPRPYLTPSDTGVRSASTYWQADVKNRWRDGSSVRTITGVLTGDPYWTKNVSNDGGLVSIVELNDTATATFSAAHGIPVGARLVISGAVADADLNRDHYVVVSSTTYTVTFNTQNVANGTYAANTTPPLKVAWVIEPSGSGLCRIKSPNHRLEVSEAVTIAGLSGMSGVDGSWRVTATAQDEFLINTTCTGSYGGGGAVTGPDFGSVRKALVSFVGGVPASGSLRVDIVNSADACHLGNVATCRAAGLSKAGMLAFNGGTWEATLGLTVNVKAGSTGTITTSARTMLTAWDGTESYCGPRYWQLGPVVTQLILEYGCEEDLAPLSSLNYDFGWKTVPGTTLTQAITSPTQDQFTVTDSSNFAVGTRLLFFLSSSATVQEVMTVLEITSGTDTLRVTRGDEGSTATTWLNAKAFGAIQWTDATDDGYKSIHPAFALTFNSGWPGVKIETRVENEYWDKGQTLYYVPTITIDGVVRMTRQEMKHPVRTRWRKTYWSGANGEHDCGIGGGTDADACATTGGGTRQEITRTDHNTDYLTHARALLSWPRVPTSSPGYWGTQSPTLFRGYDTSDRGDVGVDRWSDYQRSGQSGYPLQPFKYLGGGTWGADAPSVSFAQKNFTINAQEGWPLPVALVLWVQSWDAIGYELMFGTSIPGGGAGNSAVENYITWAGKEAYPRSPYVAGWPNSSFGRWISTHVRPSMITSYGSYLETWLPTIDVPKTSCWTSSAYAMSTSTSGATGQYWPCASFGAHGGDSWNYETAHVNDWAGLAEMVTGDEWWQGTLMKKAAWAAAVGHAVVGRNVGKIWAYSIKKDLIRHEAWGTQTFHHALSAAPTELLYGQTTTPERNLMLAYAWDGVYFAEGLTAQTDGWASILYGPLFTSSCSGYPTTSPFSNLDKAITSNRYLYGRCSLDMGEPSNPLGIFPPAIRYHVCVATYLDCAAVGGTVSYQQSMWQWSSSSMSWRRSLDLGFPGYTHVRRMMGRAFLNATLNKNFNGYLASYQDMPASFNNTPTLTHAQSWAQMKSGYAPAKQNINSFADLLSSGDLTVGTSYRNFSMASFYLDIVDNTTPGCTPAERPPLGCTGRQAYDWYLSNLVNQDNALSPTGYPKTFILERQEITAVSATLSGGTATIRWLAPNAATCTVAFNPESSLDTGYSPGLPAYIQPDVAATANGRLQVYTRTESSPGDVYRITCGQARVMGVL